MSQPYKIALVGVGKAAKPDNKEGNKIGYQHAINLAQFERGSLVAGVDISEENLKAWQKEFGIAGGYLDYAEMLRDLKPDIVCIATYVGTHYQLIEQAARAGVKGIVCEKPFLNSPAEIKKLRALVAETGVKIVVNHMRRHQPLFQLVKKLIADGRIGQPEIMSVGIADWDLSEWGAHWLDIFRFFNADSPVKWVLGQTRTRGQRAFGHAMEEHAVAYFQFENGCKAIVDGGTGLAMSISGSEGSIRIVNEGHAILLNLSGSEEFKTDAYGLDMWLGPWNALADWLEGGDEPDLGATNQLLTSELNLAAYLSALEGDQVDLPLDSGLDVWPVDAIAAKIPAK
jgi:predicted dehydrogenase